MLKKVANLVCIGGSGGKVGSYIYIVPDLGSQYPVACHHRFFSPPQSSLGETSEQGNRSTEINSFENPEERYLEIEMSKGCKFVAGCT